MSDQQTSETEDQFLLLARNGKVDEIRTLLSENESLDVNCKGKAKSNRGWTALHLASYFGHVNMVEYLLETNAIPDVKNFAGDTPLHKAAFTSREDVVRKLLEYNTSVFIKNDERNKPVDVACDANIKAILQAAEKVQTSKLIEKLFNSVKDGKVDGVDNALSSHPDIVNANTQDDLGNTPLHYAAMRDNHSVAVYLLHHGGDSSVANKEGHTAVDMCKTAQLGRLLDVQPIQNSMKSVQRFEGFLYKRKFMRLRLHWVVLDKGVLSYFARHADAVTGSKRRMFKYLTDAVLTVKEENTHSFQIKFFDETSHYLQVKKSPEAHISRQKWIQAFQLHIDYSSHYAKVGKLNESDSEEEEEEVLPMVNIQNTVETGLAHHELLKKQVDEFAVAVHKLAVSADPLREDQACLLAHACNVFMNELPACFKKFLQYKQEAISLARLREYLSYLYCYTNGAITCHYHRPHICMQMDDNDTSQVAQMLLGKCHQILSISNEMTSAFSSCLTTLNQQDQVRKIQLSQEKEKTRVWQQAFEALATEHHHLERTLSHHSRGSLEAMSLNQDENHLDVNGYERPNTADSGASGALSDEDDAFFDAFGSEEHVDFESSPIEVNSQQHNDNLNNQNPLTLQGASVNGQLGKAVTHYEHNHKEFNVTKGGKLAHVIDDKESIDRTYTTEHGSAKIHVERKFHSEKEVRRKDMESVERETSDLSSISDTSKQFQDAEDFMYRAKLPVVMFSRDDFSFWSILKQCIGKELSKITMPVIFNEPLSFLQRLCEYMEYTYLIKKACTLTDPIERLQTVAAFSVSALASQLGRVGKPYNPLLGETFEYNRPDLGFHWVSEQVSHHPPVSAFHATGTNSEFEFHGHVHPKLKFWGRSVEVEPKGIMVLTLKELNETYTWSNPHASVQNVVVGKPWIEQHGVVEITNHSTKDKCVLNFKSHSWFRSDLNKVEGYIINSKKEKVRFLEGDWTKHLYCLSPEAHSRYKQEMNPQHKGRDRKGSSGSKSSTSQPDVLHSLEDSVDCIKVWEADPRPSYSKQYYSFTSFAMTINEFKDGEKEILPPTDTRRRPDIRCQENGSIDEAGEDKCKLEEKQRAARKIRNKKKEEWTPRWFKHEVKPETESLDWIYNPDYEKRDWSSCPDIF